MQRLESSEDNRKVSIVEVLAESTKLVFKDRFFVSFFCPIIVVAIIIVVLLGLAFLMD